MSCWHIANGTPTETHGFEYDGLTTGTTNAKGRLTKVTDASGGVRISYTAHGRVATRTQLAGGTALALTYSYNSAGQLSQLTTPSGQQIGYGYLNNRVTAITVNGQTLLSGAVTLPTAQVGCLAVGQQPLHLPPLRHRWPALELGVPQRRDHPAQGLQLRHRLAHRALKPKPGEW